MLKTYLSLVIAVTVFNTAAAQVNIKVAFLSTYGKYEGLNGFYNDKDLAAGSALVDGFQDLKIFSGLDLGLRYMLDSGTAFEGGWNFGQPAIMKQSRLNESNALVTEKWKLQNSGIYLGLQQHLGGFSFGSSLQYNRLNLKTIPEFLTKYQAVEVAPYWTAQFHIQLEYRTNFTAIALRPHYSLPITGYKFSNLGNNKNYTESLTTYGLSLIIYNGE